MTNAEDAIKADETMMSAAEFIASIAPMTATSGQIDILADLGSISRSDSILEIWCGGGDLTAQLAEIGGPTVGADYSRKLIDAAAERFPSIEFVISEADDLAFEDDTFDVVVSNFTAHHYAEPEKVFAEAYRVLRPQGRLLVTMPIQSKRIGFNTILEIARQHLDLPNRVISGGPLLDTENPEGVEEVLQRSNFVETTGQILVNNTEIGAIETLFDYAWKKIGLDKALPAIQDIVRAKSLAALIKYRMSNGVYCFPDGILAVRGKKILEHI